MKRHIITIFIALVAMTAWAQQPTFMLSGSVVDSFTGEAVDSCLVEVWNADSTAVVGSTYNAGWGWRIDLTTSGDYIVSYSHRRYTPQSRHVRLNFSRHRRPRITLDPVKLRKRPKATDDYIEGKSLGEVVVTASKIKMVMRGDTVVYNADAFELANGSMLDALVRQLPGVELKGGRIYVNGEFVDNLLVNGRNFFRGNPKIALDNLPAYMVDKVKVYRRESDSDVALGIQRLNNREKELVMDVGLKRIYSFGWSVNADVGMGTDSRYRAKLFGLRFSNYTRSVAFLNSNNTNDASTPGTSGQWSNQYELTVPSTYTSAGLMHTIDDRQRRFTYEGEVSVDYNSQDIRTRQSSVRFLTTDDTYSRLRAQDEAKNTHIVTRHSLELKRPGSGFHATLKPKVEYTDNRSDAASWLAELSNPIDERMGTVIDSIFFMIPDVSSPTRSLSDRPFNQQPYLISTQAIQRHLNGHLWSGGMEASASFKLSELGDVLHLNLSGNFADGHTRTTERNSVRFYQSSQTPDTERRTQGTAPVRRASGSASVDCPVTWSDVAGWMLTLTPSLTFDMKYDRAPRLLYFVSDSVSQTLQTLDAINSYHSTQRTLTGTPRVGITLFRQLKSGRRINISANTLLRLERHQLDYQRNIIDTCLTKRFAFIEPQMRVNYERPNVWLLQLEYNMKQQAPAMIDFIPYHDNTNPLIINLGGNDDIRGMMTHNVSLFYRNMDFRSRKMFQASLAATVQPRQIARAIEYDASTGIQTVSLMNMHGRNAVSGMVNYRTPFTKKRRFYANATAQATYSTSTEFVNHKRTVNTFMPSASLHVSYEKSHTRIEVGANTEYAHITSDEAGFQPFHFFNITYGAEGHTLLPLKIELAADAKVYTRRGYNDTSMNTDRFVVGASLSRGLMNDRLLLRLSAYDILKQLDAVTRTVNAYGRTETWQNVLGRYAMLSVSYKFNKQPKKRQ